MRYADLFDQLDVRFELPGGRDAENGMSALLDTLATAIADTLASYNSKRAGQALGDYQ